jgi:hypothetical protein
LRTTHGKHGASDTNLPRKSRESAARTHGEYADPERIDAGEAGRDNEHNPLDGRSRGRSSRIDSLLRDEDQATG